MRATFATRFTSARRRQGKFGRALLGLAHASHPFPLIVVVSLTALIGLTSMDGGEANMRNLLLATLAMFSSQLAIGWSNDFQDRDKDRLYQPSKPIPRGLVDSRWLPVAVIIACLVALLIGLLLGPLPLLLLIAGTACGLAYNFRIKDTAISWLPYLLAFAILPPFVWSALDSFRAEFAWLYVFGPPLTVAIHISNSFPDAQSDRAYGNGGLVTRMTPARALALLAACLLAALLLLAVAAIFINFAHPAVLVGGLGAYGLLTGAAAIAYLRSRPRSAFRLIALGCAAFALAFLLGL